MSALYEIEVVDRKGPKVSMHVKVVHPDSMDIPTSKTFAFLLLTDTLFSVIGSRISAKQRKEIEKSPLFSEVGRDDVLDEGFVTANAAAFVKKVKVSQKKNAPPRAPLRCFWWWPWPRSSRATPSCCS